MVRSRFGKHKKLGELVSRKEKVFMMPSQSKLVQGFPTEREEQWQNVLKMNKKLDEVEGRLRKRIEEARSRW